jgi:hypothetical protein
LDSTGLRAGGGMTSMGRKQRTNAEGAESALRMKRSGQAEFAEKSGGRESRSLTRKRRGFGMTDASMWAFRSAG